MSKSRASKTKAAGAIVGLDMYKNRFCRYFSAAPENRAIRRAAMKGRKGSA